MQKTKRTDSDLSTMQTCSGISEVYEEDMQGRRHSYFNQVEKEQTDIDCWQRA